MLIKKNDQVSVEINPKKGYIIRLSTVQGATYTIKENGNIEVGQSGTISYTPDIINCLQKEIKEGQKYMEQVRKNGYPTMPKPHYLKAIPNCIYEDDKGNIILYLGNSMASGIYKRAGRKYIYEKIPYRSDLTFALNNFQNELMIFNHPYAEQHSSNFNCLDSYMNPPKNLVKLLYIIPDSCRMYNVNGFVYQWKSQEERDLRSISNIEKYKLPIKPGQTIQINIDKEMER